MIHVPVEKISLISIEGCRTPNGKIWFEGQQLDDYPNEINVNGVTFSFDEVLDEYLEQDLNGNLYELVQFVSPID
jgi:hypothetical protein